MNGTEFLRRVKDLYPDTRRIVMSGYTELQTLTDAINEGAIYRFVTKPWDDQKLRTAIREAFRRHELACEGSRLDRRAHEVSERVSRTNLELQVLVQEKADRITRDSTALDVIHEAVDNLPLPLIGADPDGMIALINRAARALFPLGAVGGEALHALPAPLARCLTDRSAALPPLIEIDGRTWCPARYAMGSSSQSAGLVVTLFERTESSLASPPERTASLRASST
jgi:PAS domain-containing protein